MLGLPPATPLPIDFTVRQRISARCWQFRKLIEARTSEVKTIRVSERRALRRLAIVSSSEPDGVQGVKKCFVRFAISALALILQNGVQDRGVAHRRPETES
jgi:hypothetical protein